MNIITNLKNFKIRNGKSLVIAVSATLALAFITSFFLQYFQLMRDFNSTIVWVFSNFRKFMLSTIFIFSIYILALSLFGNIYFSSLVCIFAFGAICYTNLNKLSILGAPLYPVDFYQVRYIKELIEMIGGHISLVIILITLLLIFAAIRLIRRLPKPYIGLATRTVLLTLASIMVYTFINFDSGIMKKVTAKAGVNIVLWNQPYNYNTNGFVFGLLSNLQNDIMTKPDGYSKETVDNIVKKYKSEADAINKGRQMETSVKPNIIFIMSETFWDPTKLNEISFSEDPMKNLRELMSSNSSGALLSPEFGGNTANVEFEALTGLSMRNLNAGSIPYQQNFDNKSAFPSLVYTLKNEGYTTLAVHPYNKAFYKRDTVYKVFGFDDFIGQEDMSFTDKLSADANICDEAVTKELLMKLQEENQPVFIHTVTMQNHLPISEGRHGENSIDISSNLNESLTKELATYSEGIKQSDMALNNLVKGLKDLKEPTIVVFWGDHMPALSGSIYQEAGYSAKNNFDRERMYSETPLLIYSNFPMERKSLGSLSPAFLGVTLFDMLQKPVTPFYAMLEDIKKEIPGLKSTVSIGSDNKILKNLSSDQIKMLDDYKMIQYDLMLGDQYSLKGLFNLDSNK